MARKTAGTLKSRTPSPQSPTPKAPTKLDAIIDLLARDQGANINELCAATGWQSHSVRGALAGAVKRKGHKVVSTKSADGRVYRLRDPL